ncbi:MAG: pyridoxal phosphate-dependent aminotransferase [bacterium]
MSQQLPKFLTDKHLTPSVDINPDLNYLGTETAFGFGAEVLAVESSKKFPQIYKFHVGDTGPKTPEPIIEVARQALKDKQTKYGHFKGYPQIRENVAKFMSETRGVDIKTENVILQPGGKPAIELTMQALLGPGDSVIVQNPGYPIYDSLANFYTRGRSIPWTAKYNESKERLEFRLEDLEKILEDESGFDYKRIKLLCLNTPQNPTGMVMGEQDLHAVAQLAKKYNFMVIFDEIYDQITFNGRKHFSMLSIPGMLERIINLNGYSKNYAMTGWRLGFIIAPEWLIEIFGQLAINKWSCVGKVNQIVAGVVFGDVELDGCKYESVAEQIKSTIQADIKEYERKGGFLVDSLRLLKPYVVPNEVEGAFYDYPRIVNLLDLSYVKNELNIKNDKDFVHWLLYEKGIACLAGADFGTGGQGHIRFSYAEDRDQHIIPGIKYFIKVVIELIEKSGQTPPIKIEEIEAKVGEIEKKYFG